MTAEGDNRVLMQKVVKDIFSDLQKKKHNMPKLTQCPVNQIPKMKSIANLETMTNLIYFREQDQVKTFGKYLQKRVMKDGIAFFDVWMYEVSDEIQGLATAFGDRFMLQESLAAMAAMSDNLKAQAVVERVIFLYCIFEIKRNLGWYTLNGCISQEAASAVNDEFDQAVKDFVPHMNTCVEALGMPTQKHLVGSTAKDYVAFNAQDDNENWKAAGELFDFRTTGDPRAKL